MLKKLRMHLTGICILMTGIVFFALLSMNLYGVLRQYRGLCGTLFENTLSTVSGRLLEAPRVDSAWLGAQEARGYIISVKNNGKPFFFKGVWSPPTQRDTLIAMAEAQALTDGVDVSSPAPTLESQPACARFQLTGQNGDRYRTAVIVFPFKRDTWLSLTILQNMAAEEKHLRVLLLRYALLAAVIFAALCVFSWFLAGRAMKPAQEGMNRQKAFIASASHELRSPVAVIATSVSAIRVDPAQTEEMLSSIESECALLSRLVDDLLLLANMDTASWQMLRRPVDMDTVLIETAEKLEPIAREQGFSLRLDMPEDILPAVYGDPERIAQVITILVDNALKHAGKCGSITIRAGERDRTLSVEVVDHGIGIPPEERKKVFDRFYSVSASRHERHNFGLGLSIAAELARLHEGRLVLEETPGGGCTFRLTLPLLDKL